MTKEQVLAAWGKPEPKKYGENIWMYSTDMNMNDYEKGRVSNATLYQISFEKGKIIKIEKYEEGEYKFGCSTVDL